LFGPDRGAQAADADMLISLARPANVQGQETRISEGIDRLLAWPSRGREETRTASLIPREAARLNATELQADPLGPDSYDFPSDQLFPGISSLQPLQDGLTRLASLEPGTAIANSGVGSLIDSWDGLESAGRLVGNPIDLYSHFVIKVSRSQYTVELYGMNGVNKPKLLFDCRAGLGSPEYPTPSGSYYLLRIFDDHPLWIPPQDRDWAYGMAPSHSVYGGHMLPLFIKKQVKRPEPKDGELVESLDRIAPPVEMVDSGGYRVHGTDSPWSIGGRQSHGCVRLLNSSVKKLADTLKMYAGTTYRDRSPNGTFISLARPVKIVLY